MQGREEHKGANNDSTRRLSGVCRSPIKFRHPLICLLAVLMIVKLTLDGLLEDNQLLLRFRYSLISFMEMGLVAVGLYFFVPLTSLVLNVGWGVRVWWRCIWKRRVRKEWLNCWRWRIGCLE